jgi:hypothetical protein
MAFVQPFKITVAQSAIDRLHQKLDLTYFPEELDESGWEYGAAL